MGQARIIFTSDDQVTIVDVVDDVDSIEDLIGGGSLQLATVTLTNAQIKASPTPTPIVIVPATETLGGSDFPTSLPVPVSAFAFLDARGGAYGDISVGDIQLSYGINTGVGAAISAQRSSTGHTNLPIAAADSRQGFGFYCLPDSDVGDGYLQDNSLVAWINNGGTPLSGGNAANSLKVTVYYTVVDV